MSSLLEIEDVESLRRAGDYVGGFARLLGQAALLKECSHSAKRSDVRAGGQKLKKFAAGTTNRSLFHSGRTLALLPAADQTQRSNLGGTGVAVSE